MSTKPLLFGRRDGGRSISDSLARTRPVRSSSFGTPIEEAPDYGALEPVVVGSIEPEKANGDGRQVSRMGNKTTTSSVAHSLKSDKLATLSTIKDQIIPKLMERIDMEAAAELPRENLWHEIQPIVSEILAELRLNLNKLEQTEVEDMVLDEMLGLGPLERLLNDDSVTDIMVNGSQKVYVERKGKLELTDVTFRNDDHVMNIAQRIVAKVGRRVDQTQPLVDARLEDGSRVNIIVPPLAIRGPTISIRKFSKKPITLDMMTQQNNLSEKIRPSASSPSRTRRNCNCSSRMSCHSKPGR